MGKLMFQVHWIYQIDVIFNASTDDRTKFALRHFFTFSRDIIRLFESWNNNKSLLCRDQSRADVISKPTQEDHKLETNDVTTIHTHITFGTYLKQMTADEMSW